jgi:hypothetical protein
LNFVAYVLMHLCDVLCDELLLDATNTVEHTPKPSESNDHQTAMLASETIIEIEPTSKHQLVTDKPKSQQVRHNHIRILIYSIIVISLSSDY